MKIKSYIVIVSLLGIIIVNIPYLSQTNNNLINLAVEILITAWLLTRNLEKQTIKNNIPIIVFVATMIGCTYANVTFSSRLVNSIVTGYGYILFFIVVDYFFRRKDAKGLINQFFLLVFFLAFLELLAIIVSRGKGIGGNEVLSLYFIGNKFFVSYTHMLFLALSVYQIRSILNKKKQILIFLSLSVYVIFVCHIVDCNTGVVGSCFMVLLIILMNINKKLKDILFKPYIFICFFVLLTILLAGTEIVVGNTYFQDLFLKYSHTNKLLTGRLEMYEVALEYIAQRPYVGYGINSTIVEDVLTWGNAQNGLLKMLLDFGIIGTAAFLFVCYDAFRIRGITNMKYLNTVIVAYLYAMALCSTVEINISFYFFAGIALLKGFNTDYRK